MFGNIDDNRFPKKQWKDVVSIQNGKDHKKVSGKGPYGVYGTGGRMLDCSEYMCEPGTIIMGRKGTIDNPYIVDEKCWIVDTAFGVNPKVESLNPIYLYYYTKLIDYSTLNKAAVLPSVTKSDLLELWIGLPEIELQDKFEQLYRQSDKSKFVRFKSQFIEMFGDPFENPKGYVKKTIGDVCDFQGGSQPPRKEFVFKPQEGYVRLIQIRDYKTDDYITYAPEKMCRRFCDADDIMIGRYGPPIFQILQGIEGAYNVALMKAIPHGINKEFMRAYLKRDELLHHLELFSTRTAGQSGIEMSELRGYPCLVPPEEEQLQYVEFVKQSDKSKLKEEDHKSGMHEL